MKFDFVKEVAVTASIKYPYRYSICTMVTRIEEYEAMIESFIKGGFGPDRCEYQFINNSAGNQVDAYKGYNMFLQSAKGEYIILNHQDVLLLENGIKQLDERIKELDDLDPSWAVLGNAGVVNQNHVAMRITHPLPGGECHSGRLPAKVYSLDENFILVKNSANLCVSQDLSGFHLHGTDLCRLARMVGRTCWVIDFNLLHKSVGRIDASFFELCHQVERKNRAIAREHLVQTNSTLLSFSSSWLSQKHTQFKRIYYAQKHQQATEAYRLEMTRSFGYGFYTSFWLLHKALRPFENLTRHIRKYSTR